MTKVLECIGEKVSKPVAKVQWNRNNAVNAMNRTFGDISMCIVQLGAFSLCAYVQNGFRFKCPIIDRAFGSLSFCEYLPKCQIRSKLQRQPRAWHLEIRRFYNELREVNDSLSPLCSLISHSCTVSHTGQMAKLKCDTRLGRPVSNQLYRQTSGNYSKFVLVERWCESPNQKWQK